MSARLRAGIAWAVLAWCASSGAQPHVVRIEPSARVIPSNTLRWYVHFDRPARGWVHQQDIELSTKDGRPVVHPFMDFGQELWSADGRRLTVLFDPGKVKRDVEGAGSSASPLQAGQMYRIAVGGFSQGFAAGAPVRRPLQTTDWRVEAPVGGQAVVRVKFDRVMDSALALDQLAIASGNGRSVRGTAQLSADGRVWSFRPRRAWKRDVYCVNVGSRLEDVSGNRMDEALDHGVGEREHLPDAHTLIFRVGSRQAEHSALAGCAAPR